MIGWNIENLEDAALVDTTSSDSDSDDESSE